MKSMESAASPWRTMVSPAATSNPVALLCQLMGVLGADHLN
jgi:hypothetical protein